MAGQIRMTPETMRQRAGEYTTQANNLQSIITKMDALLRQLQSEWEGNASEAYAAKFAELRPGFVKAKELIDEISTALKNTAEIVSQTDQNIANQFRK
jgi:WXG100 family type VII secretion target